MNNSSLSVLPLELWSYIAAFLPIASVANFSMTCRYGYAAVRNCFHDWLEKSGVTDVVKIRRLRKNLDMKQLRFILRNKVSVAEDYWPAEVPFSQDDEFEGFISAALYTDRVLTECTDDRAHDMFFWLRSAMEHLGAVRLSIADLGTVVAANNMDLCKRGMDAVRACRAFHVAFIAPRTFLKESMRAWMNREIFRIFVTYYVAGQQPVPLALAAVANAILQDAEDLLRRSPALFCRRLLHCDLDGMIIQFIRSSHIPSLRQYVQDVVHGNTVAHVMYDRVRPPWISDETWDALVALVRALPPRT